LKGPPTSCADKPQKQPKSSTHAQNIRIPVITRVLQK